MALDAMIVDLDGTLVDTNSRHVEAWRRVFDRHGYRVAADRIFQEVGKGGDKLIPAILGQSVYDAIGEELSVAHPDAFEEVCREEPVQPFPEALRLLDAIRQRGLRIVLATSSGQSHLDLIERSAGVSIRRHVDDIVTSDDADQSKPAPHLVSGAVKKLGLSPAQCAMIGDTPYDAIACRNAGVVCLGVTCGGHDVATLRRHGARFVWKDPADILSRLDEVLRIASPGSAHLTWEMLHRLMREALAEASAAIGKGEAPIGCVLARGDGKIIARAHNEMNRTGNKTAHAEIVAFARAAGGAPLDARDLLLVSTLEPCVMCTGAAMEASVDTIVYAHPAPADSGTNRVRAPQSPESGMPRIIGDVLAAESRALFERWLRLHGDEEQARYVNQLLALTSDRGSATFGSS